MKTQWPSSDISEYYIHEVPPVPTLLPVTALAICSSLYPQWCTLLCIQLSGVQLCSTMCLLPMSTCSRFESRGRSCCDGEERHSRSMPYKHSQYGSVLYRTTFEFLFHPMWCKPTLVWCMVWVMHHIWLSEHDNFIMYPVLDHVARMFGWK